MNALQRLRDFAAKPRAEERCALCAALLGERHAHLVELAGGRLLCACAGCATAFDHPTGKFRRVRGRVLRLPEFRLSDAEWQALGIPVGLAFFRKRAGSVTAFYPSPLGAIESSVAPEAWGAVVRTNPDVESMESDVEALLVRRKEAAIVPLDRCYELIGLVRRDWRGFSGGDEVWRTVDRFFEELS
jgi:hypothetical protein